MKHKGWLVPSIALLICLSACNSNHRALSLEPEEDNLPACDDLSTVLVENLTSDRVNCSLVGASLTFPDGTVMPMGEFSGSGSYFDGRSNYYSFVNVGNYGVVASHYDGDCDSNELWGSAEAQKRVLEAFGKDWPCTDGEPSFQ